MFLHFMQKLKIVARMAGKQFLKQCASRLCRYPAGKKFRNQSFSHRFQDKCIHLTQKFKMATKNCRKQFWGKRASTLCSDPVGQKLCQTRSFLHSFEEKCILRRNSRWLPKMAGKRQILQIPCGSKISSKSLYLAPFLRY